MAVILDGHGRDRSARLARAWLDAVNSAKQARKNARRLRGETSPEYAQEARILDELQAEAERVFPEPWRDGRKVSYAQQVLPTLTDGVAQLYSSQDGGEGIYGLMSDYTHPTLYTIMRLAGVVVVNGTPEVRLQLDLDSHDERATIAVTAFYDALARSIRYFGWSPSGIEDLNREIDRVLPGALQSGGVGDASEGSTAYRYEIGVRPSGSICHGRVMATVPPTASGASGGP